LSKQEDDDFAAWQAKLAAELDPEAKAAWEAFSAKATDAVREKFYRGTLRQNDYNRIKNEALTEKQQAAAARADAERLVRESQAWYEMSKPEYERAVKKAEVLQAALSSAGLLEGNPAPAAPAQGASVSSEAQQEIERLKQQLENVSRGAYGLARDQMAVTAAIQREGFSIDPVQIFDYSAAQGVPLSVAFERLTADERAAKAEAAIQARIDAKVAEERRSFMASAGTPDAFRGAPRMNILDQLKQTDAAITDKHERKAAAMAMVRESLTQ
jgi:hypothetical protein